MKSKVSVIIGVFILVVIVVTLMLLPGDSAPLAGDETAFVATIYKSPTCGCCGVYASYLKREGYIVEVEDVEDIDSIKEQFDIPHSLESCHTMEMGGYIIEGHIPEVAIHKLLTEKPDIAGIGLAGMPVGSPGMSGRKSEAFVIYEITDTGERGGVFMTM